MPEISPARHRGLCALAALLAVAVCQHPALASASPPPDSMTFDSRLSSASEDSLKADPALFAFALEEGERAYLGNCSTCHGPSREGGSGAPNLADAVWIWGGSFDAVVQTVTYGVRAGLDESRFSEMPAFGETVGLSPEQISDFAEFTLAVSGGEADPDAVKRAAQLYDVYCWECHGDGAKGRQEGFGAPDLTDGDWLFGGGREAILQSIRDGRAGVCPAWRDRLDAATIKAIAAFLLYSD